MADTEVFDPKTNSLQSLRLCALDRAITVSDGYTKSTEQYIETAKKFEEYLRG